MRLWENRMKESLSARPIQWFPGHMTKTLRLMEKDIRNVDAVLQLLDARIPRSSLNPEIARITAGKPHLYVLNKADLADPDVTARWVAYFRRGGDGCLAVTSKNRGGVQGVKNAIETELAELLERRAVKGMAGAKIRVMVVGIPNVGKSTLVSVVSEAKPIIADYHFTTLTPVLGVVRMGEGQSFVMADIPGLIEGASEGVGLGHEFLRHVERCRLLVHIVDVSGSEGRDPIEDFEKINQELAAFNPELAQRPQIVAGNKCDLAEDDQLARFASYIRGKGYDYYPMSAAISYGTKELIDAVAARLHTLPPVKRYEREEIPLETLAQKKNNGFTITEHEGVYFVEAPWLIPILNQIDPEDYESLQYFERVLRSSGIIDGLVERGVHEELLAADGHYAALWRSQQVDALEKALLVEGAAMRGAAAGPQEADGEAEPNGADSRESEER